MNHSIKTKFSFIGQLSLKKILLIITSSIFLLSLTFYLFIAYLLPIPDSLLLERNFISTKIYDRHDELLYEVLNPEQGRKTYLKIEQMPKTFVQAIVVSEDSDYYNHIGIDFSAIARAFFYNSLEQKVTSGASTITQQLVRNMMGTNRERNFQEKIIESIYAIRLSHAYSKDQILEQYLNTVYFGNMSYGAPAAALNYFNKNLYDLDLAEQTILAGLPQSPSNFNPLVNFEKAKKRQRYVLDRLVSQSLISQKEADAAFTRPLVFRKNSTSIKAPHFVHHILAELEAKYGEDAVLRGGLTIKTTLDYSLQQKAEQIIDNNLSQLSEKNVTNGALLSAETTTGQILVWVGSRDFFNDSIAGQVDLVNSLRQPGSALKPFLYLMALENGYTLATIIADLPFKIQTANGNYSPLNYDLDFHGPVRVREALGNSLNIPAVKTLQKLQIEKFLSFLQRFGLQTFDRSPDYYGLALTLGGGEVRLSEMLVAYSALANYGKQHPLSDVLEIKDSQGKVIKSWVPPHETNILGPHGEQNAFLITNTLSDPSARLKSFGDGNVLELGFPAAVKTGTTRNFKDNWAFGYTTNIVTGVWVGNSDASSMEKVSGIDGAGPIWHDFMTYYHQFNPAQEFRKPSGLSQIEICAISGLLPGKLCPEKILEYFVKGTEPKQTDTYYQQFTCPTPTSTQYPRGTEYPSNAKTLISYPPEYQKWAEERGFLPPSNCHSTEYSRGTEYPTVTAPLEITSPLPGDAFQIDQNIPLSSQKIPFRYLLNQPASHIQITLDNQILETRNEQQNPVIGGQNIFWLPTRGTHHLQIDITLVNGQKINSPKINFTVE